MHTNILENTAFITFPLTERSKFSIRYKFLLGIFWAISIFSITGLLIFYVLQINGEISEKYNIQKYRALEEKLTKENNVLGAEFASANSLNNIAQLVADLNFEKVEKINYIRVLDSQVVKK